MLLISCPFNTSRWKRWSGVSQFPAGISSERENRGNVDPKSPKIHVSNSKNCLFFSFSSVKNLFGLIEKHVSESPERQKTCQWKREIVICSYVGLEALDVVPITAMLDASPLLRTRTGGQAPWPPSLCSSSSFIQLHIVEECLFLVEFFFFVVFF